MANDNYIAKCTRCGATMPNGDFHDHVCENMRSLYDMDQDVLLRVINNEITEDDAWGIQDTRN